MTKPTISPPECYFYSRQMPVWRRDIPWHQRANRKLSFKDFPDHPRTFQPIFLMNDICRFWKTMLLNYEHKRHGDGEPGDEIRRRSKVKNFKLKV